MRNKFNPLPKLSTLSLMAMFAALLAVTAPGANADAQRSQLVVRASGDVGSEEMRFVINGVDGPEFGLTTSMRDYTHSVPGNVTDFVVEFFNGSGAEDLNVDWVEVNGERLQSEGDGTRATGRYISGQGCTNNIASTFETLHCNGNFTYDVPTSAMVPVGGSSSTSSITIRARATQSYADLQTVVNGVDGPKFDLSTSWQTLTFSHNGPVSGLVTEFVNGSGADMYVDYVTVNGERLESDSDGTRVTGFYVNGQGCTNNTVSTKDVIYCSNGFFTFDVPTNAAPPAASATTTTTTTAAPTTTTTTAAPTTTTAAPSADSTISIRARGTASYVDLQTVINGADGPKFDLSTSWQTFNFTHAGPVTDFVTEFVNGSGADMYVDYVLINGVRLETDGDGTRVDGFYINGQGCTTNHVSTKDVIYCSNGSFTFDVPASAASPAGTTGTGGTAPALGPVIGAGPNNPTGTNTPIVIRARGAQGSEEMRLIINGADGPEWDVTSSLQDYTYTYPGNVANLSVELFGSSGQEDLIVDYVLIDGVRRDSESDGTLSTGAYQGSCVTSPVVSTTDRLLCNGEFIYDVPNTISGSSTPTAPATTTPPAPTGTVLLDADFDDVTPFSFGQSRNAVIDRLDDTFGSLIYTGAGNWDDFAVVSHPEGDYLRTRSNVGNSSHKQFNVPIAPSQETYLVYSFYLEPGFDAGDGNDADGQPSHSTGIKMPGLIRGNPADTTGGNHTVDAFSGRLMIRGTNSDGFNWDTRDGLSLAAYVYGHEIDNQNIASGFGEDYYFLDGFGTEPFEGISNGTTNGVGDSRIWELEEGKWVTVVLGYRVDGDNGWFKAWTANEGETLQERLFIDNLNWTGGNRTAGPDSLLVQNFWGGNGEDWYPDSTSYMRFRDFAVYTNVSDALSAAAN